MNNDLKIINYCGDNAQRWAKCFKQTARKLYKVNMDEGWLAGWFANAIEVSTQVRKERTPAFRNHMKKYLTKKR